ncbi:hypothetical protein GA0070616_0405 [Micromonospora nigra]|uniref:DUF1622 domain-containing protein n=1 Tax=Micromonospora nigra TaxID=145857 RepID=A0A1C6RB55_9ACTN|nr:hypothetical protein GA0070616_0405 [Micromonospora nigra]
MTTVLHHAALVCLVGGVVAATVALLVVRNVPLAFRVLVDLWLAAGLIRLAQPPSWQGLLTVVMIILVRRIIGLDVVLHRHRPGPAPRPRSGDGPASR